MFWVISVYFNLRNILPKSGTFLPGHPVYIYIYIYIYMCVCVCVCIEVIHNNSKTHKFKCYKLVFRGNMFRPHCGHLQADFYKKLKILSADFTNRTATY